MLEPVRLTEHLRDTCESETKKFFFHFEVLPPPPPNTHPEFTFPMRKKTREVCPPPPAVCICQTSSENIFDPPPSPAPCRNLWDPFSLRGCTKLTCPPPFGSLSSAGRAMRHA